MPSNSLHKRCTFSIGLFNDVTRIVVLSLYIAIKITSPYTLYRQTTRVLIASILYMCESTLHSKVHNKYAFIINHCYFYYNFKNRSVNYIDTIFIYSEEIDILD